MRKLILATLLLGSALFASAQSGTNSPYSQYGLGVLSDQTSGFNRGMNGVGLGFHEHNQVNYLNPASYASLDSLTFIFDAGISGQITNFNENGVKKNANNSNFEYAVAGFRLFRHLGMSFGVVPFTNIGYDYSSSDWVNNDKDAYYTNTFHGEGGLHQAYVGAGWSPIAGLSVGANISYVWGSYTKYITNSYSNSYYKTLTRTYNTQVNSYKIDLGVQYTYQIDKKNAVTAGVTFSPGHNLGASADMNIISNNTQTNTSDTIPFSIGKAYKLPTMIGVRLIWNRDNQCKVGFCYPLPKWGSLGYPTFEERSRSFLKRVAYRAGISYATPYYKVNGVDGPKELSVSAGFGIPIINSYNNRSQLNISGQWVKSSANGLIKENTFRINIGFTFNEDWFKKWKMQ